MKLKIAFRMLEGEVIALFRNNPDDRGQEFITSYMHVGQHGGASRKLFRRKKATPEQYADLLEELKYIYEPEHKIVVVQ